MKTLLTQMPSDFLIASALMIVGSTAILGFLISLQVRQFVRQQVGVMLLHYCPARVRSAPKLADLASLERASRSLEGQLLCFDRTCQTRGARATLP